MAELGIHAIRRDETFVISARVTVSSHKLEYALLSSATTEKAAGAGISTTFYANVPAPGREL